MRRRSMVMINIFAVRLPALVSLSMPELSVNWRRVTISKTFLWKKKKPIRDLIPRLGSFSSQLRVFLLSSPLFSATGEFLHLRTSFSFSQPKSQERDWSVPPPEGWRRFEANPAETRRGQPDHKVRGNIYRNPHACLSCPGSTGSV